MLITAILVLAIFALLMDGYYVTNHISKVSEKAQVNCQSALSHKVLRYLSANCSDIMDITTAKELLTLHTAATANDIKQISIACFPTESPTQMFWWNWCVW